MSAPVHVPSRAPDSPNTSTTPGSGPFTTCPSLAPRYVTASPVECPTATPSIELISPTCALEYKSWASNAPEEALNSSNLLDPASSASRFSPTNRCPESTVIALTPLSGRGASGTSVICLRNSCVTAAPAGTAEKARTQASAHTHSSEVGSARGARWAVCSRRLVVFTLSPWWWCSRRPLQGRSSTPPHGRGNEKAAVHRHRQRPRNGVAWERCHSRARETLPPRGRRQDGANAPDEETLRPSREAEEREREREMRQRQAGASSYAPSVGRMYFRHVCPSRTHAKTNSLIDPDPVPLPRFP